MGTLYTNGFASRKVDYDVMTVIITFYSNEKLAQDAAKKVLEDSEIFLAKLKESGIDISDFRAGQNTVEEPDRYSEDKSVKAHRTITYECKYDLGFVDFIMSMISSLSLGASVSINPAYSKLPELHQELIKEVIKEARAKAELIADEMGLKITGVKNIKRNEHDDEVFETSDNQRNHTYAFGTALRKSDSLYETLKNQQIEEIETIYVEWIVE